MKNKWKGQWINYNIIIIRIYIFQAFMIMISSWKNLFFRKKFWSYNDAIKPKSFGTDLFEFPSQVSCLSDLQKLSGLAEGSDFGFCWKVWAERVCGVCPNITSICTLPFNMGILFAVQQFIIHWTMQQTFRILLLDSLGSTDPEAITQRNVFNYSECKGCCKIFLLHLFLSPPILCCLFFFRVIHVTLCKR